MIYCPFPVYLYIHCYMKHGSYNVKLLACSLYSPILNKIALVNKSICSPLMKFDSNTFNCSIKMKKSTDRLRYFNRHYTGTRRSSYGKGREGHLLAVQTSKTDNMIYEVSLYFLCAVPYFYFFNYLHAVRLY